MLRDEIARYTELSGNDGEHTPIGIIGAFLDGYETGLKDISKREWIPVSERLPEEDKEVLIFTKDKEINKAYHTLKEWSDTEWEWFVFGTLGYSLTYSDDEVLAWQPLPESYMRGDKAE